MKSHRSSPNDSEHEHAFDALLAEAFGAASPPELSSEILTRLDESSSSQDPTIRVAAKTRSRRRSKQRRFLGVLAGIAAIAASIAIVLFVRNSDEKTPIAEEIVRVQHGTLATDQMTDKMTVAANDVPAPMPRSIPKGTPMVVPSESPTPLNTGDPIAGKSIGVQDHQGNAIAPIVAVAAKVDEKWHQYWQAIGVTPSNDASPEEVAKRFEQKLGMRVSPEVTRDVQLLLDELSTVATSHSLAEHWLSQITGGGIEKLNQEQRDALVDEAAMAFRGEQPLNEKLVDWISGSGPTTSAFYKASTASGHDAMVSRLASVTMDVDLRCTKCHDALIQGDGRQESYWSFANFLRNGVKRSRDGKWSIASADQLSSKPSFYELPDGRQRFVQPKVDETWISSEPAEDVRLWASNLQNSPELARGIVHSVWQMVHGRPLRAHVIDTVTAPHHRLLDELQQQLADDLIESNFDVARTLALILTAPPSCRSVPEPLQSENQLMASADAIRKSIHAVDAFAAAQPVNQRLSLPRRLAIAMKNSGRTLKDLSGSDQLLANIASTGMDTKGGDNKDLANPLTEGFDFPVKTDELPAQWLSSIKSYQSRVAHLGYLANQTRLPETITEASEVLLRSNRDEQLALQRVWWLIRP